MNEKQIRISFFNTNKFCYLIFLFLTPLMFYGQSLTVSGNITDTETGLPLLGVNIIVKGTNNGTTSDFDGAYQIKVNKGEILVFSYIGFVTVEREVALNSLNISMQEDAQSLKEVIVIGYGTTTVKDATGSLTAVKSEDFNKGNIVTPENLLNGRVAGLTVVTGGAPGSGSTIRIRGGSSLGASNDPLIVIDGLPIDNNTISGGRSILSSINPNEIDSFTVLKDASATAIYGSRASNGVIIITTKRGGKNLKVDFNLQIGANTLPNKVDVFSADEYRKLVNDKRPDLVPLLGNSNTDWQDEIYRTGIASTQNLSLQGELFKGLPVRLSIGHTNQEGLRLTSQFERSSGSITLSPNFFDNHLSVLVNANMSIEDNRFSQALEWLAKTFDPTQPVYDETSPFGGFFQYTNLNDDGVLNINDLRANAYVNPVAELLQRNDTSKINRYFGNIKVDYKFHFLPELKAVVNMGYDEQTSDGTINVSDENPLTQSDGRIVGSQSSYTAFQRNKLFDGYLNYKKELGKFNFGLTAGYSFQKFESGEYNSNELLDDGVDTEPITNIFSDLVLIGFFGRTNLTFWDKYLLTLSYRRDGASRFSSDTRWGNFPSAAVAWKVSEDLFPNSKTISTLKFRFGWGITGQQDIGRTNTDLYLAKYVIGQPTSQYIFGNSVLQVGQPQFRNDIIKWEETTTYNLGVDFGLMEDRFTGSIELFSKESEDLLANAPISDGSNFSNAGFQNVGSFTTEGIEFSVNGDVINNESKGFNWNVNYNAALFKREIKSLATGQSQDVGDFGKGVTVQTNTVGFTPYSFSVYKQVYDENGKPVEGAYADLNGDNIINADDKYIHHNGDPQVTMGFLSNMSYKSFDLSFNLRASIGNYAYNGVDSSSAQYSLIQTNSVLSNLPKSVLQSDFEVREEVLLSDYFVENASFLKMDNVTLGYTFNEVLNSSSTLRLSASVQNVFVITEYSGIDPEVFNNGIDSSIYPRPRTFMLGANIKF